MANWIEDLQLEGQHVVLTAMNRSHKSGLLTAAADGNLWELWFTSVPSELTINSYLDHALSQQEKGLEYPFVVVDKKSGTIIGATRYYSIQPEHRRLEIGYTWYASSFQRTAVNTECKLLLLEYAFEQLKCIAVQFMTHAKNKRSRAAIMRLGAKQDGILRNHRIGWDGSFRDSVVFSIIDTEWGASKKLLQQKLNQ